MATKSSVVDPAPKTIPFSCLPIGHCFIHPGAYNQVIHFKAGPSEFGMCRGVNDYVFIWQDVRELVVPVSFTLQKQTETPDETLDHTVATL